MREQYCDKCGFRWWPHPSVLECCRCTTKAQQATISQLTKELAEAREETKRLRAICSQVGDWWTAEGMRKFDGAPAAIFNARRAAEQQGIKL